MPVWFRADEPSDPGWPIYMRIVRMWAALLAEGKIVGWRSHVFITWRINGQYAEDVMIGMHNPWPSCYSIEMGCLGSLANRRDDS